MSRSNAQPEETRADAGRSPGFTLLELLTVVAVIGVIAAIAIPNLLNAMNRARQKHTMADLRAVASALECYSIDHGNYPVATGGANLLVTPLEPFYLQNVPEKDAWGRDLLYEKLNPTSDGASYTLWSRGADGAPDGNDGHGGEMSTLASDIVIFDGSFTQWPAGGQE